MRVKNDLCESVDDCSSADDYTPDMNHSYSSSEENSITPHVRHHIIYDTACIKDKIYILFIVWFTHYVFNVNLIIGEVDAETFFVMYIYPKSLQKCIFDKEISEEHSR